MKIPQTGHRPHRRRGDAHYAHYESLEGRLNGSTAPGGPSTSFRLFAGLVLRTVALAWRSALAGAAGVGAQASPALARRAAVATMEYERAREAADATRASSRGALRSRCLRLSARPARRAR